MTQLDSEPAAAGTSAREYGGDSLLDAYGRIPEHVVYREFVKETVVLNLQTGTYHGLNATAGLMLEAVDGSSGTLREALHKLIDDYGWSLEEVEQDFATLCRKLAERGLLDLRDAA